MDLISPINVSPTNISMNVVSPINNSPIDIIRNKSKFCKKC